MDRGPNGYSEHRKIVRAFEASIVERFGYWACITCGTHNSTTLPICSVCKSKNWKKNMPTERLSMGLPIAILQNVAYALPAVRCLLFCDVAAATFTQSTTQAFTVSVALTPDANEQIECSGGFLKCTSGNVTITLKRA